METENKTTVNTVYHRLQTTIRSYLKPNKVSVSVVPENHGGYTVNISDISGLTERIDIKEDQIVFSETSSFNNKFRQEMASAIVAAFYSVSKMRFRVIFNQPTVVTENKTFSGITARAAQFSKLKLYKALCLILFTLLCFSWFNIPFLIGFIGTIVIYLFCTRYRAEFSKWVSEVKTIWKESGILE
jgi:hypothetical protein